MKSREWIFGILVTLMVLLTGKFVIEVGGAVWRFVEARRPPEPISQWQTRLRDKPITTPTDIYEPPAYRVQATNWQRAAVSARPAALPPLPRSIAAAGLPDAGTSKTRDDFLDLTPAEKYLNDSPYFNFECDRFKRIKTSMLNPVLLEDKEGDGNEISFGLGRTVSESITHTSILLKSRYRIEPLKLEMFIGKTLISLPMRQQFEQGVNHSYIFDASDYIVRSIASADQVQIRVKVYDRFIARRLEKIDLERVKIFAKTCLKNLR